MRLPALVNLLASRYAPVERPHALLLRCGLEASDEYIEWRLDPQGAVVGAIVEEGRPVDPDRRGSHFVSPMGRLG